MINYPIYVEVCSNNDYDRNETFIIQINNDSEYKMFLLLGNRDLDLFTWEEYGSAKPWSTDDISLPQG